MIGQRLVVALVRHWWMPVLGGVIAGVLGLVVALLSPGTFEAAGSYVISPQSAPANRGGLDVVAEGLDALSSNNGTLVNTYADVMASPRVVTEAAAQVQMGANERDRYEVAGVRVPDSNVVQLSVRGPDPARAGELGHAIASVGAALMTDLYRVVAVEVIRDPRARQSPVGTSPQQNATVAALLGIVAGASLAFSREALDASERSGVVRASVARAPDGQPTTQSAQRGEDADWSTAAR